MFAPNGLWFVCARSWVVLSISLYFGGGQFFAHAQALQSTATVHEVIVPSRGAPKPASEVDAVIAILQRIIDGQRVAAKPLANVLIRGRVSTVSAELGGNAELGKPAWFPFSYVRKHGKARYEQDCAGVTNVRGSTRRVYRLDDGQSLYNLNTNSLDILTLRNKEFSWPMMVYDYDGFSIVKVGGQYAQVLPACQLTIDWLRTNSEDLKENGLRALKIVCREAEGQIVVETKNSGEFPDDTPVFNSFAVDPSKGFQLVKSLEVLGGENLGIHTRREVSVEYKEIAPGVFHPWRATCYVTSGGSQAVKFSYAGRQRRDLEVRDVSFSDFSYDGNLFSAATLPIPIGAHIEDRRTEPYLTFTFGQGPLDEQILKQAALRQTP